MTKKRTVLTEGILLLVFSFVGLGEGIRLISNMNPSRLSDTLGPGWFVFIVSLTVMATGASHIIFHYRDEVAAKAGVGKALTLQRRTAYMVLAMMIYFFLIDIAGYMVSTPVFFLIEFRLAGVTSWRTNIIVTAVVSAVYYFVFVQYCEMVFPKGILF